MSTNYAKMLVWKDEYDVKLWRHKERTANANDHHMPLIETPHANFLRTPLSETDPWGMKLYCLCFSWFKQFLSNLFFLYPTRCVMFKTIFEQSVFFFQERALLVAFHVNAFSPTMIHRDIWCENSGLNQTLLFLRPVAFKTVRRSASIRP